MTVISVGVNWASVASPTLGCSIEISRDIYMHVFNCLWKNNTKKMYVKMRWRNYIVQTRASSKISFESDTRHGQWVRRYGYSSSLGREYPM